MKNFLKTALLLGGVTATALTFSSCEEDPAITEVTVPTVDDQEFLKAQDQDLAAIGKSLARSMNNAEVRQLIYTEVNKFFNGDADVLYHQIKDVALKGGTLEEQLAANFEGPSASQARTDAFQAASNQYAGLTFSISRTLELWDPATQIPLVAIVPADFDEGVTEQVLAYDEHGHAHLLSATIEPTVPVLVVHRANERVGASFDAAGSLVVNMPENVIIAGKDEAPAQQSKMEARYRRDVYNASSDRERIGAIKMNKSLYSAYEAWLYGEWEVQIAAVFPGTGHCYTCDPHQPINVWYYWKKARDNEWWTYNATIGSLHWKSDLSKSDIDEEMHVLFHERDASDSNITPYKDGSYYHSAYGSTTYWVSDNTDYVGAYVENYHYDLDLVREVVWGLWYTHNVY